jgi:hypothetical protein
LSAFVGLLSLLGMLVGLISVIYPLEFMYIYSRRMASGVLAASFVIFLAAAAESPAEPRQPQQQQAVAVSRESMIDEACNKPGVIPNCKEEVTKMLQAEAALPKRPETPKPNKSNCKSDWRQCSDNAQLVNNFGDIGRAQLLCKYAAQKLAKYGTPDFPWFSFGSFERGSDFVRIGIATLIEDNAQFQNGFGAMVHSTVICKYDLDRAQVVDVRVASS